MVGIFEGDICGRDGCSGVLELSALQMAHSTQTAVRVPTPNIEDVREEAEKRSREILGPDDKLAPARGCLLGVGIMFAVWIAVILIVRMIF